jgi:hypothetical protein
MKKTKIVGILAGVIGGAVGIVGGAYATYKANKRFKEYKELKSEIDAIPHPINYDYNKKRGSYDRKN